MSPRLIAPHPERIWRAIIHERNRKSIGSLSARLTTRRYSHGTATIRRSSSVRRERCATGPPGLALSFSTGRKSALSGEPGARRRAAPAVTCKPRPAPYPAPHHAADSVVLSHRSDTVWSHARAGPQLRNHAKPAL